MFASYAVANPAGSEVHCESVSATLEAEQHRARDARQQPHERQRPHDVPRQQDRPEQHQRDEPPPPRRADPPRRSDLAPHRSGDRDDRPRRAAAGRATRGTTESVVPPIASNIRRNNREGASQPSWLASSAIPSVGSFAFRNGAARRDPEDRGDRDVSNRGPETLAARPGGRPARSRTAAAGRPPSP